MQDSGERLELQRPDVPDTNGVAYITVDEVRYNDKAPWPPAADGSGPSLQRRVPAAYGNDPVNWEAAAPTPGRGLYAGAAPAITTHPTNCVALAGQTWLLPPRPPARHRSIFSGASTAPPLPPRPTQRWC